MDVKRNEKTILQADLILIEAEELSLDDDFMKYEPKTKEQNEVKALIIEVIEKKVKNFYRPKCDPSFTEDGKGICFIPGKMPAVGKSCIWWYDTAKAYNPKRNSRLGTRLHYGAFLGVLIKKLVEERVNLEWAWTAVCNDSWVLGHYWNSENAKHDFELTCSRMTCGFYDLANTYKILAEDKEGISFFEASGIYDCLGDYYPVADIDCICYPNIIRNYDVGWIVLD